MNKIFKNKIFKQIDKISKQEVDARDKNDVLTLELEEIINEYCDNYNKRMAELEIANSIIKKLKLNIN
jgi:hypothetical protein